MSGKKIGAVIGLGTVGAGLGGAIGGTIGAVAGAVSTVSPKSMPKARYEEAATKLRQNAETLRSDATKGAVDWEHSARALERSADKLEDLASNRNFYKRTPGLVKTALWAGVGAGLFKMGFDASAIPLIGEVARFAGNFVMDQGGDPLFAAAAGGAALRGAKNVGLGVAIGGGAASFAGGLGGAIVGANIVD